MRFEIVNLGCKVNRVESDSLAVALAALGFEPVSQTSMPADGGGEGGTGEAVAPDGRDAPFVGAGPASLRGVSDPAQADLVVVNTCTVTGEAEKKTRKAVRRALRAHPHAAVVVTGCAAAIDPAVFTAMDARVVVAGKHALAEAAKTPAGLFSLVPQLSEHCAESDLSGVGPDAQPHAAIRVGEGFPTRVGIKVQDGCNNACTYCIVHVARGRAWSRPADEVVAEFRRYVDAGVREIVLSGINLGTYRDGDLDLADLLELLLAEAGGARVRLSSIEPKDVSESLIGLMARENGRIARHLHLPLQSGCDRVLRDMARPYSAGQYCGLVERLYAAMPGLSLSTDIIVGFPGETDEDFQETLDVAQRCRFSKIHVFPYSKRAGTPAAKRPDQVDPSVKARRAAALSRLGEKLRAAAYDARVGAVEEVLVEAGGRGMTESYFEIAVPPECAPGELVRMRLPLP